MRLSLTGIVLCAFLCAAQPPWGFFGHQKINHVAVFTLPPDMIGFYKKNITYITEASVNPDKRRFSSPDEAPRHYLDVDHYGKDALTILPRYWDEAVAKFTEDTLKAYGIVPWHINRMYYRLKDAFLVGDPEAILRVSAELGHYVGDAHVPLHTTENYNGQLTGQHGIHGLWESRLPELYAGNYDFFTGRCHYIKNVQFAAWKAIEDSHFAVDSVLRDEKALSEKFGEKKYSFETKGRQTMKVYSADFSKAYHQTLSGMVERRMRAAIIMTGSLWYTAWVDAGQPDIKRLIEYTPSEEEIQKRRLELEAWKDRKVASRDHN